MNNNKQLITDKIQESIDLKTAVLNDPSLIEIVDKIAQACVQSLKEGGKVLWCGNGGSAADAQHLAAEFSGRFYYDRPPLFSEALHVNTSYLTAVGNDYGYDLIYSRLIKGKAKKGDVLIGLSTSGNSPNVVNGLIAAKELDCVTIGLTGEGGGKMAEYCDLLLTIPSKDTPRIQELHMLLGHCICEIVESTMFPK